VRSSLAGLVASGDLDALIRAVDGLCSERNWDELLELADRCEEAIENGKQLWPVSAHIDYRIALEAPAEYAGRILHPDAGRFAHGPLTEVAASTHSWAELAPHIDTPQLAAYVAQERVLRGEAIAGADERAHLEVLELPPALLDWEPTYCLATYRADHVEVQEPWTPKTPLGPAAPRPGPELDDPELTAALLDLVTPWTAESNGAARAVIVEGDALAAVSAISHAELAIGRLTVPEAVQLVAWAAASGGAHGRRRGAALGRSLAWYLASLVTGLVWPPDPASLGAALDHLLFYRWDEGIAEEGWVIRIAIENRREGWAAALAATDLLESA
jgi:hypothetical protein